MQGEFIGDVVVKWINGDGGDRKVTLMEAFSFRDPSGKLWEVPAGWSVDGASIPRLLWTFGPPFVGGYRRASVVHDYFCDIRSETWQATHRMFYDGCLAGGIANLMAKTMYAAVYAGGPRWPSNAESLFSMTPDLRIRGLEGQIDPSAVDIRPHMEPEQMERMERWIAADDPSLEDIEAEFEKGLTFSLDTHRSGAPVI